MICKKWFSSERTQNKLNYHNFELNANKIIIYNSMVDLNFKKIDCRITTFSWLNLLFCLVGRNIPNLWLKWQCNNAFNFEIIAYCSNSGLCISQLNSENKQNMKNNIQIKQNNPHITNILLPSSNLPYHLFNSHLLIFFSRNLVKRDVICISQMKEKNMKLKRSMQQQK